MVKSPALAILVRSPGIKDTQAPTIDRGTNSQPYLLAAGRVGECAGPRQLPDPACPKVRRGVPAASRSDLRPACQVNLHQLPCLFCIAQLRNSHIDYIVDLT